mmetsp:Transcript_14822/g.40743  ORF Transcript_14822/g.40743 Transcript_14822/m.40743 type:complete len:250 (+) Transcript_14822:1804-2553(+)
MMVTLNVKLHDGANCELRALMLCQQAVTMHKEVAREAVGIDEAPSSLKRTDVAAKSVTDPVAGSQQCPCRDLLCHGTSTVVESHVELNGLTLQWWRMVPWRLQQIVTVDKQVAVEGGRIQEAPPFRKTTHVAAMPLTETLVRFTSKDGLHHHRMRAAVIISLDVELHGLTFLENVTLELRHDAFCAEEQLAFEQVAFHEAPTVRWHIFGDRSLETFVLQIQGLLHGLQLPFLGTSRRCWTPSARRCVNA